MKHVSTDKAPKAIGPYSQAVIAGNFVFVSGQLPVDPKSGNMVDGEIEQKAERIFENVKAILEAAGSNLESVVKVTIFVKDIGNFNRVNAIYEKYFREKPARSFIEVSNLPRNADIEVELIATIDKV